MATITYPGKCYADEGEIGTAQNGGVFVQVRKSVAGGIADGSVILVDGVEFLVSGRGKIFAIGRKEFVRLYATAAPVRAARELVDEEDMGGDVVDRYVVTEG